MAVADNIGAMRVGVTTLLSLAWKRALDLVFPPRCAGCGSFGAFLCPACLSATPRAQPPRCPVCWMPGGGVCGRCLDRPFAFEAARCPFAYAGAARAAVHALKYQGISATAEAMAREMSGCLTDWPPQPVLALVPVPLAGSRKRSRGYNQSEVLAQHLSRLTGVPVCEGLLVRRKGTQPQARALDEATRRANVADAFSVQRAGEVDGPLLLVDDVMTSGATLDACARALGNAGYGPTYAVTFARED